MKCTVRGHGEDGELEKQLHDKGQATHVITTTCPACGNLGLVKLSCRTYAEYFKASLEEDSSTYFPCNHCYVFVQAHELGFEIKEL